MATALVVEPDADARQRMTEWLEAAGLEALGCRGPEGPEYVCPAGFGGRCPLAVQADVVVLDLWLDSDSVGRGTPGCTVLFYYQHLGLPVLPLTHSLSPVVPLRQPGIVPVPWPPARDPIVLGVLSLLAERPSTSTGG
jgi:hypothetical protein